MQDKDSTRSSTNKRMNVVHRCIRTPNIVLRALRVFSSDSGFSHISERRGRSTGDCGSRHVKRRIKTLATSVLE